MRLLIIGTSGAGKSTLAARLAEARGCPYIELDALYWGPNWQAVATAQFRHSVSAATEGEHWIADGNYSAVHDILWSRATHVLWLNYGRWTVFGRVLWRTVNRGLRRTELFSGNRESMRMAFLSRDSVLLWSLSTWHKNRVKFAALRDGPQYPHLQWTELNEPAQVQGFIAGLQRGPV